MENSFSVLIPIYNFNIFPLVEQLDKIAKNYSSTYQIVLIDDFSSKPFRENNRKVQSFKHVTYLELDKNLGRSKIRNLLFEQAKYEKCIILDCDVLLAKESFIKSYLDALNSFNVVVGGHKYLPFPPKDETKFFHWYYGKNIEVQPFENRKKLMYASFMTNSFAITKTLFEKIKFDESITDYGHEDTLFGFHLKRKNIPILHINNPVVHLGLENDTIFLAKQQKAIKNLAFLYKEGNYKRELEENIKLIQFYNMFYTKWPYSVLISLAYKSTKAIKFMSKKRLNLTWLNLWKLEKFHFYFSNS